MVSSFRQLGTSRDFADVTLACEDGQQIEAHKMILAASSPFFQNLLKRNKHPHPLIYMKGIMSENLLAIVDFLYCGEANVYQENLDSFLAIAAELKMKGFMGQTEDVQQKTVSNYTGPTPRQVNPEPFYKQEKSNFNSEQVQSSLEPMSDQQMPDVQKNDEQRIPNFVTVDLQELDEKVKSMMEKSSNLIPSGIQRARICKVCGKEGQAVNIRDHIEFNHLEGVSLPCNVCGKDFKSRNNLRRHTCTPK